MSNNDSKIKLMILDLVLAIVLILPDQLLKSAMYNSFKDYIVDGYSTIEKQFIKGVIYLRYLENRGAAWSSFSNQRWFLLLVSGLFMALIIFIIFKLPTSKKFIPANILLSMIVAGGIGNMIDRVKQGYVIDYLGFDFWRSYPIFNFADICVVIGVIGLFVLFIFVYKDEDLEFLKFMKKKTEDNEDSKDESDKVEKE